MKTFWCLLIFLFSLPFSIMGQSNLIVDRYTVEEGLPSNTVYSAIKDKDGFVWFGTWHGLCSFDGTKFTSFITRTSRQSDMPPRKVRTIVDDGIGNLWVRNTDNHLYVFNKRTEIYHDIYNELKRFSVNVQVIKIQLASNGRVLVLTRNKNLFEAYVGKNDKIVINKLHDSKADIDQTSLKLKHNVLGESAERVYWISTDLNIDVVNKKDKRQLLPKAVLKNNATCFNKASQYLCIGTKTGDIYIVNTKTKKTDHHSCGTKTDVYTVNVADGKVFYTTSSGLYSCSEGNNTKSLTPLAANSTRSFKDKYNNIWLCSNKGLLVRHETATGTSQTFTLPSDSLFAEMKFTDTGQNGMFMLMRNGEVWHYDHQTHIIQNINKLKEFGTGISEPRFFDIDIDSSGILWLSSTSNGIYKVCFPKYNFKFIFSNILRLSADENDVNGVRGIYQAKNGDLWIGTRNGELYCIDIKTNAVKRKFGKNEIGSVYHMMEDKRGNYWFSTKGSGLIKATPDALSPQGLKLTRYVNHQENRFSLSSNRVYYTYQDSHDRIWVCTFYGGLNLIQQRKDGSIAFLNKKNSFKNYPDYDLYIDVRSIVEDRHGRLWVGTTDGLMSFDGNFKNAAEIKFETYREQHSPGVIDNDIYTMYKDHKGYIWMGIFGSGLNKIEYYDEHNHRPVLKPYVVNEKHGGDVISSMVEDHNNCLWMCTETGLTSLKEGSSFVRTYDRFAGFPNVNIEDNTSMCLKDGRILIGCRQGLLAFNPSIVRGENETKYNTFIVDFKVANRDLSDFNPPIYEGSVKYAEKIELKHNLATFTIEFSSPYFTDNHLIPYIYILDGYEDQWHENGNNRIASYANVPPGHYKFRVKVNDNNSPERVLEIVILPPWWATWWAYTIYAILLLLALYGATKLVLYMIKMRNEVYINDRLAELKIRFFTNVSHELRTPLSLIKGPIEELKTTEKLSPTGKEYLTLIDRNARKMLQLVNQILDFRKIQNGKMKLHISLVDINSMIEMLMQDFRMMAEERDIAFEFERSEEHVLAWCDAEKMGVVLNNLINNAFKYTSEGGKIIIVLEYDNGKNLCTIRVEDDGAGIPKSQLELIFERFSQADNKISDDALHAGTGIGLSLSREYISMHHGRIWAENLDGRPGVAFSVEIYTDKEHFSADEIEVYYDDSTAENHTKSTNAEIQEDIIVADNIEHEDSPTIMVVEDNHDLCRMLQLQLKDTYKVITAHDGAEGMDKIYRYHPDIIITDLMMPGMDGMELLKKVRQDFTISHIPVIMLTAKNTEEDRMKAVKRGANAFIPKPFSSSYLSARINQLLEEQRIFQRKMVVQSTVENTSESNKDEYEQHLVKKDIEFVHKIHEIIETNLNANDFNIDTIAETIGLSRSAFFKKLKSLTGFAPVDLVREIRLTKAAKLIETTDDSITEIAYSVGFRDSGYFGKCFRKKYEMTPKEYRNKKRDGA
ncbi:MAG: two-component regulator propeller domain-containing protein [Prevotellaceae bacterium]|nr:two-component regulator propeller domain-containing protein [Prevotellaceae bacterium]